MNADEAMAHYEARRVAAHNIGDTVAEAHWAERIQRVSDQQEMMRIASTREVINAADKQAARWHDALELLARDHA